MSAGEQREQGQCGAVCMMLLGLWHLLGAGGQAADVDASRGARRLGIEHLVPRLHLGRPRSIVRQRACGHQTNAMGTVRQLAGEGGTKWIPDRQSLLLSG